MTIWVVIINMMVGYSEMALLMSNPPQKAPIYSEVRREFKSKEEAVSYIKENYQDGVLNGGILAFYEAKKLTIKPIYTEKSWEEKHIRTERKLSEIQIKGDGR